jgi:putative ABC transport system permease protein
LLTFIVSNFRGANTPELRSARIRELRDRLAALPGVRAVTSAGPFPLDGRIQNARYWNEAAQSDASLFQQADVHIVQPGYFQALGTRLLEGRDFTEADNRPEANVVVIDNLVAAKAYPHQSAVGKRLFARFRGNQPEMVDIIGVVAHQRHATLTTEGREAIFFADGQFGFGGADRWALRTGGDPSSLGPAVRAAIQAVDPLLVVSELQPMSVLVDKAEAQTRFALICIAVFAAIAVLLAAVGLYGVLATLVRQRTSEIGVRLAFGAEPAGILKLVVGQGLRLSAAGLFLGVAAALALTRVMVHMLVDVTPTDPVTFVSIAALFLAIATFASWLPARRAARTDPMVALRGE